MRWRLGIAAAAVLAVAGGLVFTFASGSGSQSQVTLDGVPAKSLADGGVSILEPDEEPTIAAASAIETAIRNTPRRTGDVKETVLVRFVNDQIGVDRLAWAINFEPASVLMFPPVGGPLQGLLELQTEVESTPVDPVCAHPLYHVAFIDAETGDFITATQRSGAERADSGAPCPTPDPDLTPAAQP